MSTAPDMLSSRMSMDRCLNAPLSDEPAFVPAINAALKRRPSPANRTRSSNTTRGHHSCETSINTISDGWSTFFTMGAGSAPDTLDTSYTTNSKAIPQRIKSCSCCSADLTQRQDSQLSGGSWPDRARTSATMGPADAVKNGVEGMEKT